MDERIAAIVVSWNLREGVLRCVESLARRAAIARIILVDNASSDGTPEIVKDKFPSVDVIRNDRNMGFAAAANTGLRRAAKFGLRYSLLANSDVVAPPGSVERLLDAMKEEKAGAVGAKLVNANSPDRLDGAYGVVNWRNFVSRVEGKNEFDSPKYSTRKRVDYPLGALLLLDNMVLEKTGLFDESYFAYHEEMELCERIRRAGYPVIFEPVAAPHGGGASVRAAGAELAREYLLARNSVRFVRKYGSATRRVRFWFFVFAASVFKFPLAPFTGGLSAHLANVRGWRDGMLNKPFDDALQKKYKLI